MAERDEEWRLRPVLLAGIGAVAALAVQQLLDTGLASDPMPGPGRVAIAATVASAATAFGFGADRVRWWWAVVFAGIVGVTVGLVTWWNGGPGHDVFWDWRSAALFLSVAIAAPLFQTARDEGGWRFPYAEVHAHAWTNVVLWFASWAFTGVVMLMALLLSELFQLVGIRLLREALATEWFVAPLAGGAFGAALGLFRERDRVIRTLQRVVTAVLGVLAPVLGLALLLFLFALPFTGLGALWEATKATTPILLTCAAGALVLANAVIGDGVEDEARNPALRWGAIALAAVVLPLAIIAAVATGLRIGQYGFTPDRLWGLTFVVLACAYGLAYWVSLARGRLAWAERVRPANLNLAFATAGLALFLALPILSFNAISARDQVARLEAGRVTPERFDWAALAFDFGEPGRTALARLKVSRNAPVAAAAREAAKATNRYDLSLSSEAAANAAALVRRVRVVPAGSALPDGLRLTLARWGACGADAGCTVAVRAGGAEAVVLGAECGMRERLVAGGCIATRFVRKNGGWAIAEPKAASIEGPAADAAVAAFAKGRIEVREVTRRQVFVGDTPVGQPFD